MRCKVKGCVWPEEREGLCVNHLRDREDEHFKTLVGYTPAISNIYDAYNPNELENTYELSMVVGKAVVGDEGKVDTLGDRNRRKKAKRVAKEPAQEGMVVFSVENEKRKRLRLADVFGGKEQRFGVNEWRGMRL